MGFVWSMFWSGIKGAVSRNLGVVVFGGLVTIGIGVMYAKGMSYGYKRAEKKLLPKIRLLETENNTLKSSLKKIKDIQDRNNDDLEAARKAGEAVKPVNSRKPDERLRLLKAYPGCRDC